MTPQALFTLDLDRCTGCSACAVACSIENDLAEGRSWRRVHTYNASRHPAAPTYHLSLACNHCLDPACMRGCPAAAYSKDPHTGVVGLNQERCIGCGYCAWVCPYDAPQLNRETGVMEKCTFCAPRLAEGLDPACVQACPVDALGFVPRGEPVPQVVAGFPDTGLGPAIAFTRRRGPAPPTPLAAGCDGARFDAGRLRSEWPLLFFSLILTGMVAWFWSALAAGSGVHGPGFALAGLAAMAVSTLHLGRPTRAWRALSNLRTSWVSREILFFSAFWISASAVAFLPLPAAARWIAAALGLIALVCVDMVYRVPGQRFAAVPHSAMTSLTALFLLGLALPLPWLALVAGAAKLALFPWRAAASGEVPYTLTFVRVGLGLAWPVSVWLAAPAPALPLLLAGPLVAEIVDRVRFYAELSFMSPARQIALDSAQY